MSNYSLPLFMQVKANAVTDLNKNLNLYMPKLVFAKTLILTTEGLLQTLDRKVKILLNQLRGYEIVTVKESSFDFLANLELLISNESSIHLDALLVKVPSIVYNFSNNDVRDSYSYIKNGMVKLCTSTEELRQLLLDGVKVNIEMVRYYVASFSTPYEGRVGEHIASFIEALLIGEEMKFINENYIFNSGYYQYK